MNIHQIITDRIIEKLKKGVIPWHKPWANGGLPKNFVTKKEYSGINCLLLHLNDFNEPYYLTFNQVKKLGASIKQGSKSQIVVYWNWIKSKNEIDSEGQPKTYPLLRYYRVFNVQQVIGLDYTSAIRQLNEFEKNDQCEAVIADYKGRPRMIHKDQRAFYQPSGDFINMPIKESFSSSDAYYATLFHELVHSTGHNTRLNREGVVNTNTFGSTDYSKEELIAEMGASFLCAKTSIDNVTFNNSVSYINGWLSVLKMDSKFLIHSATQAQKAVDFILNINKQEEQPCN